MAKRIHSLRGFHDMFARRSNVLRNLLAICERWSHNFGYRCEAILPLVEHTELFHRSLGGDSDIVSKEMFTFADRDGHPISLRPEGTAGLLRAVHQFTPEKGKHYYQGQMYRYERPQAGRSREFWQFGVESLGQADPCTQAEGIALADSILRETFFGPQSRTSVASPSPDASHVRPYTLALNSIGDPESRARYSTALRESLELRKDELSELSRKRLAEGRVLRILDSKAAQDRVVVESEDTPQITSFISDESRSEFNALQKYLDDLNVPYSLNPFIVRGLDYYTGTVFEFLYGSNASGMDAKSGKRTQHTSTALIAGGCYDDFIGTKDRNFGKCFGWAAGISRISHILMERGQLHAYSSQRPIAVLAVNDSTNAVNEAAMRFANSLRQMNFPVVTNFHTSVFNKQFELAVRTGCVGGFTLGEAEIQSKSVTAQDFRRRTRELIPISTKAIKEKIAQMYDERGLPEDDARH